MNSVEKVKILCKENKTPVSKLERDLGFANGYISQLRKGVFPTDRALAIARYFAVPLEYITGESEQKEKPSTEIGEELSAKDMALKYVDDLAAAGNEKALWEIFERLSQKMQKK